MKIDLTPAQEAARQGVRAFMEREVAPHADRFDREGRIPDGLLRQMAEEGYLGSTLSEAHSGREYDMISFGLLCEEAGRASASLLSLLTVHTMAIHAIERWGTEGQKERWLGRLARGEVMGAFALTEPEIGSDAKEVKTKAEEADGDYLITGRKKWVSGGRRADLFLVFTRCGEKPTAFLVESDRPGLTVEPVHGMLGFRSAMIAELGFDGCRVSSENLLGRPGFGSSHIAGTALDVGRYCIAWGSVGIAQGCVEASIRYSSQREQFGNFLKDHQMIQEMLANMITETKAARLLCLNAGYLKDIGSAESIMETSTAKYYASRTAVRAALDAVQIHGANGCSDDYPVQRYFRDAKIMEIIEGSSQMQQMLIAKHGCRSQAS